MRRGVILLILMSNTCVCACSLPHVQSAAFANRPFSEAALRPILKAIVPGGSDGNDGEERGVFQLQRSLVHSLQCQCTQGGSQTAWSAAGVKGQGNRIFNFNTDGTSAG